MPEAQDAGATPDVQGATPDAPGQGSAPAATAGDDQLGASGLAALQKERDAAAAARKESEKLAKQLKAYEDRDKTDSEKKDGRIAELERELETARASQREANLRVEAIETAGKLGFRDPDLAYRLVKSDVDFADDGTPRNLEKLLGDAAKTHPYLVAVKGGGDTGLGPRGAPVSSESQDVNTMIRRAAGRA